ncbi:NAD(P)/FAD-dependent oxidoreductase [Gordonia malaquae]|uniref:NAD(P)/FAD-dependent oxidoreductase n=1 Tax=Gordonia malaquae TaxID=410332 RepID=UPI00301A12C0
MSGVVIVGGGLAGVRTAEALRSADFAGPITLLAGESHLPYDRPPLSKSVLTQPLDIDDVAYHSEDWYEDNRIDLRLNESAESLDPAARVVHTSAGSLPYDDVVIATGARARDVFTDAPSGVITLRTIDDARRLRESLRSARRLVIVGAGFIGLEVASSARELGVDVVVAEASAAPLSRSLGTEVAELVVASARSAGVEIRCGATISALIGDDVISAVELADGERLECDVVVVGVGSLPNIEWLADSGLDVGPLGLLCDHRGAAAHGVWGVGDVAAWSDADGIRRRHEHWTSATEQARALAHHMTADTAFSSTSTSYVWSDQFGRRINIIGDTGADADVRIVSHGSSDLFVLYARGGHLVGACVVDNPRRMVECRRWIAAATPVSQIPAWSHAA